MTEESIRDAQGQFLPGNPLWRMGAFKPGHPGCKPNAFTPEDAHFRIKDYFENQELRGKPPNMSGIRLTLGILGRNNFIAYQSGEVGKTDEDRRAYKNVFDWASLVIESYCEEELFREKGQVQGIIRALENKYGWRDVRHLSVERINVEDNRLIIIATAELAANINEAAGESVEFRMPEETMDERVVSEQ